MYVVIQNLPENVTAEQIETALKEGGFELTEKVTVVQGTPTVAVIQAGSQPRAEALAKLVKTKSVAGKQLNAVTLAQF